MFHILLHNRQSANPVLPQLCWSRPEGATGLLIFFASFEATLKKPRGLLTTSLPRSICCHTALLTSDSVDWTLSVRGAEKTPVCIALKVPLVECYIQEIVSILELRSSAHRPTNSVPWLTSGSIISKVRFKKIICII